MFVRFDAQGFIVSALGALGKVKPNSKSTPNGRRLGKEKIALIHAIKLEH
jgi:hypothetical protein